MFTDPLTNLDSFGVEPGMKIADMGAGSGFYSIEAAKRVGETGKVYAIEVQKEVLARIKNEAEKSGVSNIEYIWGDIEVPNGTRMGNRIVDAVLLSNTLFQVEDKKGTLMEAFRVLKPKGRILLVDWTDSFGGMGPAQNMVVTKEKARKLLEECGFVFVKEFDPGDHHYALVMKKQ